jgi:hypothetical protein
MRLAGIFRRVPGVARRSQRRKIVAIAARPVYDTPVIATIQRDKFGFLIQEFVFRTHEVEV